VSKLTQTDNLTISQAQMIVTRVLAGAEVRVEWLSDKQCKLAPSGAIFLLLEADGPPNFKTGTLGYALPYNSGTGVHIFYRRIRDDHPDDFAVILGHAMAHEIGHVLQGVARHSDRGIMKAVWTSREYRAMRDGLLRFSGEDVQLIQIGLREMAATRFAARF
jgi:hypothetical protein